MNNNENFGDEQIIGYIIEELIDIKDRLRDDLYRTEIDALNNACNILEHRFNRYTSAETVIDKTFCQILWTEEDIKNKLEEKGIEPTDEMIKKVLNVPRFKKTLEEITIERGWDIIEDNINQVLREG